MFCPNCGKENPNDSYYCRSCGFSLKAGAPAAGPGLQSSGAGPAAPRENAYRFKSKWTAFFLCLVLGWLGGHRFYAGKIGTGILYALTFGGLGFGWFMDLFAILCGAFRDKNGYPLM